ncbi:MAG: chalcone isomerase family protein [Verrucomicrobiota bacterium]
MKKFLPLVAAMLVMPFAGAVEIQGVKVPPSVEVNGQSLPLNGAGLRTFSLLMIPIKIYVAAFYAPGPLKSEAAVLASPGPLEFTFTFLRAVDASDVAKAWSSQFAASASYTYPGYEKDRDAFVGMFGALQQGGVQMVRFVGTDTQIFDQGSQKGTIAGRDFQKAFLSMWFGSNPVSADLKSALLGN